MGPLSPAHPFPQRVLEQACGDAFPGAVAWVDHGGTVTLHSAVGFAAIEPEPRVATVDTVYDLASLTKPIAVTTLLVEAIVRGALDLDTPARPLLPDAPPSWDAITVAHLAGHTAGLPAYRTLDASDPRADLLRSPLLAAPGQRAVYSDFGYIALGWVLEAALGDPLPQLLSEVAGRYDLGATAFRPLGEAPQGTRTGLRPAHDIAPTERGVPLGVVHDPNGRILRGVAGHAGLFGTAADVGCWARRLLHHWRDGTPIGGVLDRLWYEPPRSQEPTTWRLGFDTVTVGGSSAGRYFGPRAVGHLGYTGTSVWLEPDLDVVIVLLSNRVHPQDLPNPAIKRLRPAFHDAVMEWLEPGPLPRS